MIIEKIQTQIIFIIIVWSFISNKKIFCEANNNEIEKQME